MELRLSGLGFVSMVPVITFPPHISAINLVARFSASIGKVIGKDFSNLRDASVPLLPPTSNRCLWTVRRMDAKWKVADSRSMFLVLSSTSEIWPPITPAKPTGPLVSAIIRAA